MNDEDVIILDDGPWEAYLDGITEDALIKAQKENPDDETIKKQVAELEAEIGRKIGTASPEEIAYRKKAWEV